MNDGGVSIVANAQTGDYHKVAVSFLRTGGQLLMKMIQKKKGVLSDLQVTRDAYCFPLSVCTP